MPPIFRYPVFHRSWKKLPKDIKKAARQAITKFLKNSGDPSIKDHKLEGKLSDSRAFSVTDDIRIVYRKTKDGLHFDNIGGHDDVY